VNRILFSAEEVQPDGTVTLTDFRATHIRDVLRSGVGDTLRTGIINGQVGTSRIERMDSDNIRLTTHHNETALEPWIDLILAAPRPKVLKRLWAQLTALGVGKIIILNAFRVEKCYFDSQWLDPAFYTPLLIEGLMQAGTSRMPEVQIKPRFKPFVEDELDTLFPDTQRLLAHPAEAHPAVAHGAPPLAHPVAAHGVHAMQCRPVLAIGPEGGWIDYELKLLTAKGFAPFSLGTRTLRTDTAALALIAALMVQCAPTT